MSNISHVVWDFCLKKIGPLVYEQKSRNYHLPTKLTNKYRKIYIYKVENIVILGNISLLYFPTLLLSCNDLFEIIKLFVPFKLHKNVFIIQRQILL